MQSNSNGENEEHVATAGFGAPSTTGSFSGRGCACSVIRLTVLQTPSFTGEVIR